MGQSFVVANDLAPPIAALQQSRGPRPLPLFLSLVADVATRDAALAQAALLGLRLYQEAKPVTAEIERPAIARVRGASLLDCGGSGRTILLVPSLINPPSILDLGPERSLAGALAQEHHVLLLDWGPSAERSGLDLAGHVEELLLPLLQLVGPSVLVGYCLGGTLSLLAAGRSDDVEAAVTLAAPWHFSAYPATARERLQTLWAASRETAGRLGALPMEVLQSAFWSLDPDRVVAKFARFGRYEEGSDDHRQFVLLEDWANGGEPLPCPAARELIEDLFGRDLSGNGVWRGGAAVACPQLHVTATGDRLVPASSAAPGPALACAAGHVGMVAGRNAPRLLHEPLLSWLEGLGRGR
jgi:polyhydroxyalkanoate synthase